jgi:protease IV
VCVCVYVCVCCFLLCFLVFTYSSCRNTYDTTTVHNYPSIDVDLENPWETGFPPVDSVDSIDLDQNCPIITHHHQTLAVRRHLTSNTHTVSPVLTYTFLSLFFLSFSVSLPSPCPLPLPLSSFLFPLPVPPSSLSLLPLSTNTMFVRALRRVLSLARKHPKSALFVTGALGAGGYSAYKREKRFPRNGNFVLELDLDKCFSAQKVHSGWLDRLMRGTDVPRVDINDLVRILYNAEKDKRVKGLIARLGTSQKIPAAQLEEMRAAIERFRKTNKLTVAYADSLREGGSAIGQYYLASAFDRVVLAPPGFLNLTDIMTSTPFVKNALDRMKISMAYSTRGKYKSFLNTYTRDSFTPEHEESMRALLDSIRNEMLRGIAAGRGLSIEAAETVLANGPYVPAKAVELKLIDNLMYGEHVYADMHKWLGFNHRDDINYVYLSAWGPTMGKACAKKKKIKIAFFDLNGAIHAGKSKYGSSSSIGAATIVPELRRAIKDKNDAILLSVNSPGGSAVASDVISNMIEHAKDQGIRVVVTMKGLAASGGYYISQHADKIFANNSTITGSIGVVFGKPVLNAEFWDQLGVNWGAIYKHENALIWSFLPPPKSGLDFLERYMDHTYELFTSNVARGRHLTREHVEAVAQGRVWSGTDALKHKLVDEIGGTMDALEDLRESLGVSSIDDMQLVEYATRKRASPADVLDSAGMSIFGPVNSRDCAAYATNSDGFFSNLSPLLQVASYASKLFSGSSPQSDSVASTGSMAAWNASALPVLSLTSMAAAGIALPGTSGISSNAPVGTIGDVLFVMPFDVSIDL